MGGGDLEELLLQAGEAPPDRRILLRDAIASHGAEAIKRLSEPPWIGDDKYAAFAIRTIRRAGEFGSRDEAIVALRSAIPRVSQEVHRRDIADAIAALGGKSTLRARKPVSDQRRRTVPVASMGVEDLVEGVAYHRRELHLAGLGGNWQKGISFPADGTYCLLFSDPSKASEYGYRDAPEGESGYRYFGEWDGPGDMSMAGGNQAILDRSSELYLFTRSSRGHVFRGRFECLDWSWELTTRDGRESRAIVFELKRSDSR